MKSFCLIILVIHLLGLSLGRTTNKATFTMDERWVCKIKTSCLDCLRLPHCSWCKTETTEIKCYSKNLPEFDGYCTENSTHHVDYGMSLENNARCVCLGEELESKCYPPGVTEGSECSGRGRCECGRCTCDTTPDPEHPTKIIVGEFCEFDNFSCDGPRCNEGPYYIHQSDDEDHHHDGDNQ